MESDNQPAPGPAPPAGGEAFDRFYYAHCCGRPYLRNDAWLSFFGTIADRIVADIQPARVLDAGCALGLLVEVLRDRGVEAYGVDISSYAIDQIIEPLRPYCRQASIAEPFNERYDLIVCIEVLEHMPPREAERAIENICAHTDDVVFSSSPNDFREPTHVNVHGPDYWAEQFARCGLYRDVDFDASVITPWAVRFRRSHEPSHRIVRTYERRYWELQRERDDARSYSLEVQHTLAERERELAAARDALAAQEREAARARDAEATARDAAAAAERRRGDAVAIAGRLSSELAQSGETVRNMERSLFWRARAIYMRVRGMVGR